ncbi:MAG: hypothetical protein PHI40_07050 [Caldisericia bacterium]|jgi:hypothetical protein|nr:hypothetical protein [Caldisericia bacterium]
MNVRIIKVCKENLDVALQHSTWANKRNRMKKWEKGDALVFVTGSDVIATALVDGKPFSSDELLWPDDLYPNRIPIKILNKKTKLPKNYYETDIKPLLKEEWGPNYGWQILTQQPMVGKTAETIWNMVQK